MKKLTFVREEEVKNYIAQDFFAGFDCTKILGNIDFSVAIPDKGQTLFDTQFLLWAEAKAGRKSEQDFYAQFVQLILTIGQSGTVESLLPPPFIGAFDSEKIAFIPYIDIADIFSINDFNWRVTPSNYETKEFRLLYERAKNIIEQKIYLFYFEKDEVELRHFIKNNLVAGHTGGKIQITKNNFIHIYLRWLEEVKPHIDFNWEEGKKGGILDCDFYRADLFVDDKGTDDIDDDTPITDKLSVVFRNSKYNIVTKIWGNDMPVAFGFKNSGKKPYTAFWKKYKRPPLQEYWDYIIDRRDRLVPQDIRERKGSFFTPQKWVELSQGYIANVLGEDWQDEYYVWDCAAGTGNLLAGLSNKSKIWASTLDRADVDVMKERIHKGANLFENHVFQFDFLNDDFSPLSCGGKVPDELYNIISDPEKRKRLVVYINPPYAEGDAKNGKGRSGVHKSKIHDKYQGELGKASSELFAQFFARIYFELSSCMLAEFSTLKILQAPNFFEFRKFFRAKLGENFVVPAASFDNVKGNFPIGFFIWDTKEEIQIQNNITDVYDFDSTFIDRKMIYVYSNEKYISDWLVEYSKHKSKLIIANMASVGNDFQNQNMVFIQSIDAPRKKGGRHTDISIENLTIASIYFTIRKVIPADWLNDRDQFLYPNDGWKDDLEFQNDCLAYTLFNNNISSRAGVNHWIPFTEAQVGIHSGFESHFMSDFIAGKLKPAGATNLFEANETKAVKRKFSTEAQAVMDSGLTLWKYYLAQPNSKINASYYDIREYFQGRNEAGKMNLRSGDEHYMKLIGLLRSNLKTLAKKLEPKVYEYGFLRQ